MRLAIIPARGGSQRIKNKNIVDFCGKPLITHSLEAAKAAGIFDEIHVSTDSDAIKEVAQCTPGISVPFLRDSTLADAHTALIPVLRWVIKEYQKRGQHPSDVCLLMPTAPLLTAHDLNTAYEKFKTAGRAYPLMATAAYPVPIEWALERDQAGLLRALSPDKLKIRSQDLTKKYFDAGAFVFFTAQQLLDPSYPFGEHFLEYPLPRSRVVDIDDEDDLELARVLFWGTQARNNFS